MPNWVDPGSTVFTQWRVQQGCTLRAPDIGKQSHFGQYHTKAASQLQTDETLLQATFGDESPGAIRNFARSVLSEIWGKATLAKYATVVIIA